MKTKLFPLIIVFLTAFLGSCSTDVEPLHETVVITDPVDDDGEGGTSTGDYWPMAVENQWTFTLEGETQQPMKIIATEQIAGKTYYKYQNFLGMTSVEGSGFEGTVWTRKNGGVYFVRQEAFIPASDGNPSITVEPMQIIVLKDFLNVGETWSQSVEQTTIIQGLPAIVTEVNLTGKILERDSSITIGDQTFESVIKVELIQNTQGTTTTNYYWFAKDIGIVKYQNLYPGFDTTYEISSYTVN